MALTAAQIKTRVRAMVTDSVTELPDDTILYFAGQGATDTSYTENIGDDGVLNLYGVVADSWAYLARADRYMSESEGSVSVSQPVALRMAAYYRSLSGTGGVTLVNGQTQRMDIIASPGDIDEFGV